MAKLRGRAAFQHVFDQGQTVGNRAVALFVCAQESAAESRLAVVAGKRLGKATVRNRARRRLRAAVRQLGGCWRSGQDVVVVARRGTLSEPFRVLSELVADAWRRAGLIADGEDGAGTCAGS